MCRRNTNPRPVKSAEKTFQILETLVHSNGGTVTELTQEVELSKGSVYQYLQTLERLGYVVRTGDEYRAGLRFLEMGHAVQSGERTHRLAEPIVEVLAEETGEQAHFVVEEQGEGVMVHVAEGEQAVQTDTHPGKRLCLHATGAGKVLLAHLDSDTADELVEGSQFVQHTEHTITDEKRLRAELGEIRERGYAFEDEEVVKGLRTVAVPVHGPNGAVVGAFSVSGPTHRMKGEYYRTDLPNTLLGYANELELRLTYSG